MNQVIRFATLADADRIAEIHVATWRDAYRGMIPDAHLASLSVEQRAAQWKIDLVAIPRLVLVSEREGRIEGWTSFGAGRAAGTKGDGEIYAIYVAPEAWGTGDGGALLAGAEEELWNRGFNRIFLWVLEQNQRARAFYESRNYSLDGGTIEITVGGAKLTELRYEKHRGSRAPSVPDPRRTA